MYTILEHLRQAPVAPAPAVQTSPLHRPVALAQCGIALLAIYSALWSSPAHADDPAPPPAATAATDDGSASGPAIWPDRSDPDTVVLNVVGDISYPNGWGGIQEIDRRKHQLFEQVQPILDSGDLNFANVECPLTESEATADKQFPIACKEMRLQYMLQAGFNLFSLANNHSYDAGLQGIKDSIALMRRTTNQERPLWWAGTGESSSEARKHLVFQPPGKNLRIAFFAVGNSGYGGRVGSLHDKTLLERLTAARAEADVVLVSIHHGPEYVHVPYASTVKKFHALIDAGADLVIAHHPHVVQGVERYGKGFIFYSLGNFSFGSKTRRHLVKGARLYSMIGRVTLHKGQLQQIELIPLYANNGYRWTLGERTLVPRHATPQLLAGDFARFALDEITEFTRNVPKASETRLVRVGDRAFVDLGAGEFSEEQRTRLLHQQMHEYAAVQALGSVPRQATAGEKRVEGRGGTPDAAVRAAKAKAEREKKSKKGKKSRKKKKKKKKAGKKARRRASKNKRR